jgi:signal transduction histidine kinase
VWFIAIDGVVSLGLGAASSMAGAEDLFHGGMPMSWILVAAYGFGIRGAVPASVVLGMEQVAVHVVDDRGTVGMAGSLVFVVFALAIGWVFDALRQAEIARLEAEQHLIDEQRARARHEERANLADQLHDSVLQSLLVVRRDAEDPQQVRYLARREERRLRRAIADLRSEHADSFRSALLEVCDDVEDTYRMEVESVIRDDPRVTPALTAAIQATREALVNAAKHSGDSRIDLYSEATPTHVVINVRDRGHGFDEASRKRSGGFDNSLMARVREVGGSVSVTSSPGQGTEVTISVDLAE